MCSFCIRQFVKVREHINKMHSDIDVEIRARRLAQENESSKVRAQSFASLDAINNLSSIPSPLCAIQVCMYLMSSLSVGVFELDLQGQRHFLEYEELKERFNRASAGKGKQQPPAQVRSTEPGGEAHTLAGNECYEPLIRPDSVTSTSSILLQMGVSYMQVPEFDVKPGPSQSCAQSTPVYRRSPRKAQRSPVMSDDEQVVVQKRFE